MKNGDDLGEWNEPGVLIRVRKVGPMDPENPEEMEYLVRAPAEKLDAVMEKARMQFFDPLVPPTPPMPDSKAVSLSPSWVSPRAKRIRGSS